MRVLIVPVGSQGDWLPFLRIGRALALRGHEVSVYGNGHFAGRARAHGLRFVETSAAPLYEAALRDPAVVHPHAGLRLTAAAIDGSLRATYEALAADVLPGRTLLLGSTLAFPARLLAEVAEVARMPLVTAHLAPSALRSLEQPGRLSSTVALSRWPPRLRAAFWRVADALLLDPAFAAPLNRHRRRLGLAPVRRVFRDWIHRGDALLGLFAPEWAGALPGGTPSLPTRAWPPADWPPSLQLLGFPYDPAPPPPLDAALEAWLSAGPPPLLLTAGTANALSDPFLGRAAAACRRLGQRALVVSAEPPPGLSPGGLPAAPCRWQAAAPFAALMPRVAGVVHHGGVGTLSEALRAGVPQLIRPMAYDQFDNAARSVALGVAREWPSPGPGTRRARRSGEAGLDAALEAALHWLARDDVVRAQARAFAGQLRPDAVARAADAIEASASAAGIVLSPVMQPADPQG